MLDHARLAVLFARHARHPSLTFVIVCSIIIFSGRPLQPGEELIVGRRVREVLSKARKTKA